VLVAAREKPGEDAYLTVEGKDVVYKVADWKFDDIFPDAKELFDIEGLDEKKDEIAKITLSYPSAEVVLERGGDDKWKVASPRTGLKLKEYKASSVAGALADWKPADYAEGEDLAAFGLAAPERRAAFVTKDGKEHTLAFGSESRGTEGRYALLDAGRRVWVSDKWKFQNACPEPKDLFELEAAKAEKDDVTRVAVERAEGPFVLERTDGKWKLASGREEREPDKGKVRDYLDDIARVTASDVDLAGASWKGEAEITLTVEAGEGEGYVVRFGAEEEGRRPARAEGTDATFLFEASKVKELAPAVADLAPAAEKEGEGAEKDSGKETGEAAEEEVEEPEPAAEEPQEAAAKEPGPAAEKPEEPTETEPAVEPPGAEEGGL
jgi:hypothetical protein